MSNNKQYTMELEKYIETTLTDIIKAIDTVKNKTNHNVYFTSYQNNVRAVEFDIMIAVDKKKQRGGDSRVTVFSPISVGGKIGHIDKKTEFNRIRFGVNISKEPKG